MIRTLIVDDEPLAREGLRVRLAREDDIEVIGQAEDGPSAVAAILAHRPDLVFLDVQMPGLDGFEVLARIASRHLPVVVFVTAHDRYALRAFSVHALDYLLKPIGHRRLQDALQHVRREFARDARGEAIDRLRALLDARARAPHAEPERQVGEGVALELEQGRIARFTVRDGTRLLLLRAADVDWIEAAANYARLHVGPSIYQIRASMGDLERRLDPARFGRIHRSTIVNLDRVREITPELHGEYTVVLSTGAALRLGRRYRDRLLR